MAHDELVKRLLATTADARHLLLQQHPELLTPALAWSLKAAYDTHESSAPALATQAATALTVLAQSQPDNLEIEALATWTSGLTALDGGQFAAASDQLELARTRFLACDQPLHAAATQISQLRALTMLGRDDEALQWGAWALAHFTEAGDWQAAGKIEQNLGGLHFMRDRYALAEEFFRRAQGHFSQLGEVKGLIQAENNLATALTAQHKFRAAAAIYETVLAQATAGHYEVICAEIECNLGCLALFQGHFDRALDLLERSRRRYATLAMPHESAIADQEVADAYLELNLAPEAAAIYARVIPLFAQLGMQVEEARALAYYGRALLRQNEIEAARIQLGAAQARYLALGSSVGEAAVRLYSAEADLLAENFAAAATQAALAATQLAPTQAWGRILHARWLQGEALRRQGALHQARPLFEATLHDAKQQMVPQVAQRCYTALGQIALAGGDIAGAETAFQQAIALIETMRAPLPAEEFRIAFISDKLTPYQELVRLCLADGTQERIAEALGYVEQARARALVDMLSSVPTPTEPAADPFTIDLLHRIEQLREELNWYYSQLNRPDSPSALRGPATLAALQAAAQEREAVMLNLMRQLKQSGRAHQPLESNFALASLQQALGKTTVLVEYFRLDETLMAFVVSEQSINVVTLQCQEAQIEAILQQLHFQLGTMRYGGEQIARHQETLTARARHHLALLYDHLLRPLEPLWAQRRLLIAPLRALHYVPFHALYDGLHYVVEGCEVCYTPSAAVLHHCLSRPSRPFTQALLLGVPDDAAPRVFDEIMGLQTLFPTADLFLHEKATRAALTAAAPNADLLHLACHGRFRADNSLFSALQLADGWFTVHDATQLQLNCNLVTLSACETGVSALAPGDELLGLARGFLLAGAPALLMSLWTVDDSATAQFMHHFYTHLLTGVGTAAALRYAQCQLLATHPHPFFWAPFILIGRWA